MVGAILFEGTTLHPKSLIPAPALADLLWLAENAPPGCIVEVGVYQGGSALRLWDVCETQGRDLYLFDTFTGIPFHGPGDSHKVGDFRETSFEHVSALLPGARIFPGIFPETLPDDLSDIALAHVDCDQYYSVGACCRHLWPLVVPGGFMVFDDCELLPSATRAVEEAFPREIWKRTPAGKVYLEK